AGTENAGRPDGRKRVRSATRFWRTGLLLVALVFADPLRAADTWTPIGPPGGVLNFVAVAPSNPSVVYVASSPGGVFRSDDGGTTFDRSVAGGLGRSQILCLAVAPDDPMVVYAGAAAGAFKSLDGGATWAPLAGGFPAALINSIVVDPSHASTV